MTLLPILGRELRVRARGWAIYWTRLAVALVGVLICLQSLQSGAFGNPGLLGRFVFNSVVAAAFMVSCCACLLTADAISSERREGTLELLLLTRIRPLDVLLGKLGSLGLTSLCALAAFLPVLMIPVLAGGVTGGEAFRKGLALLDTLCVTLGAGLYASAVHRERFKAARSALVVVLLALIIPYLVFVILTRTPLRIVGLISPVVLMMTGSDLSYKPSPGDYWTSLVAVQGLAWALVVGAGWRLRRTVQEDEPKPSDSLWGRIRTWMDGGEKASWVTSAVVANESGTSAKPAEHFLSPASSEGSPSPPGGEGVTAVQYLTERTSVTRTGNYGEGKSDNATPQPTQTVDPPASETSRAIGLWHWQPSKSEAHPIEWLVYRQYGLNAGIWTMAVLALAYNSWIPLAQQPIGLLGVSTSLLVSWPPGTAAGLVGAAITAWVASRFFVAGRRSGELETLLTTPLGAASIIGEQWRVLKRLFVWPVLVMQAPMLPKLLFSMDPGYGGGGLAVYSLMAGGLCLANTYFGMQALCWLALWFGLRSRGQASAIVRTVTVAKGVPCLGGLLCSVLGSTMAGPAGSARMLVANPLPDIAILAFFIWLTRLARQRLAGELAGIEPAAFNLAETLRSAGDMARGIGGATG